MQQQPAMMNMMPPFPPASITTEQIQKYLDENKKLILAILDNQNLGKLAECAQYQAQLQKNLMYLAAIADAQPQAPAMPSQVPTHPAMQQGGHYMQHPHAAAMNQQPSGFPSKMPMQLNPQQMQEHQQQQQQQQQLQHQAVQAHFGMRPGVSNGMQGIHNEVNPGGGSTGGPSSTSGIADFTRSGASGAGTSGGGASGGAPAGGPTGGGGGAAAGDVSAGVSAGAGASGSSLDGRGSKQDGVEASSGDALGNTTAGNSNANGEPSYTKGSGNA